MNRNIIINVLPIVLLVLMNIFGYLAQYSDINVFIHTTIMFGLGCVISTIVAVVNFIVLD